MFPWPGIYVVIPQKLEVEISSNPNSGASSGCLPKELKNITAITACLCLQRCNSQQLRPGDSLDTHQQNGYSNIVWIQRHIAQP